jgi:hypothetical protein
MGAVKQYLLRLLETSAPENGFAQDAIEFAILSGWVNPTGDLDTDVKVIMSQYDEIVIAYRKARNAGAATTFQQLAA